MMRVRVFSAVYGGISRVKRHHLGVVGRVLGKEMGKDFLCLFFLNDPANPVSLRTRSGSEGKPPKFALDIHAADLAVITKADLAEAVNLIQLLIPA
jgi:hypothetical protein